MPAPAYLGEFEGLVLLVPLRLGDTAYGVTVRQEIETRTGRDVSIGTIYATLSRLEPKGPVRSRAGEPTAERGRTGETSVSGNGARRAVRQRSAAGPQADA
jgi:PadR family transcriptional regulator, regulatory protein PadR